jgi:hypothetical protein
MDADKPTARPVSEDDRKLREVFRFDQEDLDANEAGAISKKQMKMLEGRRYSYSAGFVAVCMFGLGIRIALGMIDIPMMELMTAITVVFVGIAAILCVINYRQLSRDLNEHELLTVDGRIRMIESKHLFGEGTVFVPVMDALPFDLPTRLHIEGLYRVHFLPQSRTILSMERLFENESPQQATSRKGHTRYWSRDEH